MLIVAALTVAGLALRLAVAHQSLFADELSTRMIVAGHSLADVISIVHTDAEITPPLFFVASWLTTRIELSAQLLRAPSLVAGVSTIPLVYLLGLRTIGHRGAIVAAALTTFSPFMIFYSTEARGYALMVAFVVGSTICLLQGAESGRARWYAGYAACTAAAMYTHYTSVYVLAAQLAWLLVTEPRARKPALIATAAAAVTFLPWLSGLKGDLNSRTTDILSILQPLDFGFVRASLVHWAVGYPFFTPTTGVRDLPGVPALVALALALALAVAGVLARGVRQPTPRVHARLVLVVVLAAATPVGELVTGAIGSNVFGTRNLAASWPAFALCLAALLLAAGPRLGIAGAVLAIGAFAMGATKMLDRDFRRPDYDGFVAAVDASAGRRDVVVDGVSIAPAGVPTTIDVAFAGRRRVFALGRSKVRYDPFRTLAPPRPIPEVMRSAVVAAHGGRLFMAMSPGSLLTQAAVSSLPRTYRPVTDRIYPGLQPIQMLVFARRS